MYYISLNAKEIKCHTIAIGILFEKVIIYSKNYFNSIQGFISILISLNCSIVYH